MEGDFEQPGADTRGPYRSAQEACASRDARWRRNDEVRCSAGDARAPVTDDGKGFDIVEAGKSIKGLGLVSINERVRLAGGTVSIVTELNKGTRVRVRVPANRSATRAAADPAESYATTA